MIVSNDCRRCGSNDVVIDRFHPRDFPARFFLVKCGRCGSCTSVVDSANFHDSLRGRRGEKALAARLLIERPEA